MNNYLNANKIYGMFDPLNFLPISMTTQQMYMYLIIHNCWDGNETLTT